MAFVARMVLPLMVEAIQSEPLYNIARYAEQIMNSHLEQVRIAGPKVVDEIALLFILSQYAMPNVRDWNLGVVVFYSDDRMVVRIGPD